MDATEAAKDVGSGAGVGAEEAGGAGAGAGAGAGTGGGADPMAFSHGWHQSVIEDFAQAVRNEAAPLVPMDEALHVHAVIHAMEQAARNHTLTDVPT